MAENSSSPTSPSPSSSTSSSDRKLDLDLEMLRNLVSSLSPPITAPITAGVINSEPAAATRPASSLAIASSSGTKLSSLEIEALEEQSDSDDLEIQRKELDELQKFVEDWDKKHKITRNHDAVIKLETEMARVFVAQAYLKESLDETETHKKKVDEAYKSIKDHTESLYKDMFGLEDHHEAASSGEAMSGGQAGVLRGLKLTQERIRAMIQNATARRDGEINEDRRLRLNATVNMLDRRLTAMQSIDEKAERLTRRLKSLNCGD